MHSKEIYRFPSMILCFAIILILIQNCLSQPLSTGIQKIDDSGDNSMLNRILFNSELNNIDDESDESAPSFFVLHSTYNRLYNKKENSEPVRRANFWKRANFWRKRANFWRRELAA
ncbi:unnamed protein product [Adineta steineri]|uniref:Uncharacterized protein n=1 Tax=Adineta steineri TaxID=433720 RepID=A0A814UKF4_9BILA|nr:unnamed protein product [Adineta steineri]CAF3939702.1 unnamed protein product [Adineta steineri]